MKLLLDEQIPRELAKLFPDSFEVATVQSQGLSGVKNGELLRRAAETGFDALIRADKNMEYRQDANKLLLTVVVMHTVRLRIGDLAPLVPKVIELLEDHPVQAFIRVRA